MGELKIYNMGHGDSMLLKSIDNKCGLLIDCGGSDGHQHIIRNYLTQDLSVLEKKSIMITHFHRDHINRINEIGRNIIFDDVYLPNIINFKDVIVSFYILKNYTRKSKFFQMAYNYLNIIPTLKNYLTNNSLIKYVSKGAKLSFKFGTFDVLWPNKNKGYKNNDINKLFIKEFTDNERKLIKNYYKLFKYKEEEQENVIVLDINNYELLSSKITNSLTIFIEGKSNDYSNRNFKELKKLIFDLGNNISLVMKDGEKSLFTGDITKNIYNDEIAANVSKNIKILKTPHHGSITHYTPELPKAKYAIITEFSNEKNVDYYHYYIMRNYDNLIICEPDLRHPNTSYINNFITIQY